MPKLIPQPTMKYKEFCNLFDTFLLFHDNNCYYPNTEENKLTSFHISVNSYRILQESEVIYDRHSKELHCPALDTTFHILTYNITEDGTEYYSHPQLDSPVYVKHIDEYLKTHTLEDHFGYKGDVYYSDDNPNFASVEYLDDIVKTEKEKKEKELTEEDEERLTDLEHRMNELQRTVLQLEDLIRTLRK